MQWNRDSIINWTNDDCLQWSSQKQLWLKSDSPYDWIVHMTHARTPLWVNKTTYTCIWFQSKMARILSLNPIISNQPVTNCKENTPPPKKKKQQKNPQKIHLLSHPGLGWLYVFSSRPCPRPQKLFPLTSKQFELYHSYLAQRIYGSAEMYWMTFHDLDPRSRLWRRLAKICLSAR